LAAESGKVHVFEALFKERYDPASQQVSKPVVMLDDVAAAIRTLNARGVTSLSDRNPANFIKDFLRSESRNRVWPRAIREAGFTARQKTGVGQCFEFVPLSEGQEPFPDDFELPEDAPVFILQTLSLPITTREIVRADEQSLAQIAVKLNLVEHFLASSPAAKGWGVRAVTHLQNSVKLRGAEIDSLYQAEVMRDKALRLGVATVEVKIGDPIIPEQLTSQVQAAFGDSVVSFCIPVVLKRFRKGEIAAMHLPLVSREDFVAASTVTLGAIQYAAKYVFEPPLPKL
jgi:hypothetical protein